MSFVIGTIAFFLASTTFGGDGGLMPVDPNSIEYLARGEQYQPGTIEKMREAQIGREYIANIAEPTPAISVPCSGDGQSFNSPDISSIQLGSFACPTPPANAPTPVLGATSDTISETYTNNNSCTASDILFVIDNSQTMNNIEYDNRTKLDWAKDAMVNFINRVQTMQPTKDGNIMIGVISFGGSLWPPYYNMSFPEGFPAYPGPAPDMTMLRLVPTNDYDLVKNATYDMTIGGDGNCIQCGLYVANEEFARDADITEPNTRQIVILLSDGNAHSNWDGYDDVDEAVSTTYKEVDRGKALGYEFYVIGYGLQDSIYEPVLKYISSDPNSIKYQYYSSVLDWDTAFQEIYADICKPSIE